MRKLVEEIVEEMDVDGGDLKEETTTIDAEGLISDSLKELEKSIQDDFQAVQIQWEDILVVASRAKKSTGGGLN